MKRENIIAYGCSLIFVVVFTWLYLNASDCQSKPIVAPHVVGRDTTRTLGVHMNYGLRSIKYGPISKIVVDSMQLLPKKDDSTEFKQQWSKVTYYEVIVDVVVDSAIARQFKVPVLGTDGKPNVINLKMNAEAKYVVSPVNDLDSALRYLEQFVIKDSIIKK